MRDDAQDPLLERAFARITGAASRDGNAVRLLRNAQDNYPAWLDAIRSAEAFIYFENYIIADDETGRVFAQAMMERARSGVRVYLLHDWLGCKGRASSQFWAELAGAGVELRSFNPPRLASPLAWLRRDHRKLLVVDHSVGFVSGLCVADDWPGDPQRGIEPWRDTGVELRGPVVADLAMAFRSTWAEAGPASPPLDHPELPAPLHAGTVTTRIVAGQPGTLSTYRVDQFVASAARRFLWLTDAYFVGTNAYLQALITAARDGVDVRLLVPRASDIPLLRPITRSGYRPLIEAGVRVFEWNGAMLHAKTAVADGRWARIGSTNLNVASWLGNWELDAMITDEGFAREMTEAYLADLTNATEIVLDCNQRTLPISLQQRRRGYRPGSASRLAAGAVSLGNAAGAAITAGRSLAAAEAKPVAVMGLILLGLAGAAVIFPLLLVVPAAIVLIWLGASLLLRAWKLHRQKSKTKC